MRLKLATSALLVLCVLAMAVLPVAAAPKQQLGGWTATEYILIDNTDPQQPPRIIYSTIYGVRVTRVGSATIEVTFVRNYRFLVATAYDLCGAPGWDCVENVAIKAITKSRSDPRQVRITTNYPNVMINLIVKP